jgi:hypothetical protein
MPLSSTSHSYGIPAHHGCQIRREAAMDEIDATHDPERVQERVQAQVKARGRLPRDA